MLLRVLQFVFGAALASGGGWLVWSHRLSFGSIFPPGEAGLPLMLLAGVLGLTSGSVLIVSALHPRPNQKRIAAEKSARENAALQQAEAYYSGRARAADRDWRSGDIAPPVAPTPAPAAPPAPAPPPAEALTPVSVLPPESSSAAPVAVDAPPPVLEITPVAAKPKTPTRDKAVASAMPPPVFPADATLAPIPRAQEAPPAAVHAPAPAAPVAVGSDDAHAPIRTALSEGRLDDAEKLLNAARDSASGVALAELTALAGDHAIASGRQSHAKWLWRLALKRFGELQAMDSPAARATAESLRLTG